jgi:hypothetical protein
MKRSTCVICGEPLTASKAATECYCRACRCLAVEQQRAEQLDYIGAGLPGAIVAVEDTRAGNLLLFVRWDNDGSEYTAHDGDGSLPVDEHGRPVWDGWGLLFRVDDDGESEVLLDGSVCAEHPYGVTDDWLVAAILADRRRRSLPSTFDWPSFTAQFARYVEQRDV